jgi:chaperonin cofactor prefoldin
MMHFVNYKEEVIGQMEQVKEAFDEERSKLQQQSQMLQDELEEVQRDINKDRNNRKKMDEMSRTINNLNREKRLV